MWLWSVLLLLAVFDIFVLGFLGLKSKKKGTNRTEGAQGWMCFTGYIQPGFHVVLELQWNDCHLCTLPITCRDQLCCSSGAAAKHQNVGRAFLATRAGGGVRTESLIPLGALGSNHCLGLVEMGTEERARRCRVRLSQSLHRVLCRHLTSGNVTGPFLFMQIRWRKRRGWCWKCRVSAECRKIKWV